MRSEIYQINLNLRAKELNKHYSHPLKNIIKSKSKMKQAVLSLINVEILYIASMIEASNSNNSNFFALPDLKQLIDNIKKAFNDIAELKRKIDKKQKPDSPDPIAL